MEKVVAYDKELTSEGVILRFPEIMNITYLKFTRSQVNPRL